MIAYIYNKDTKIYNGMYECQLDPLESSIQKKEIYLQPDNSTLIQPPEHKDGMNIVWDGVKWTYVSFPLEQEGDSISEHKKVLNKIEQLKGYLFATDFKVLKVIEKETTEEEFEPMRLQRKAWREEIRALQKSIEPTYCPPDLDLPDPSLTEEEK